jgi:hypothetical protein
MPKGPSNKFSVERTVIGEDGRPMHGTNSMIMKEKICMGNGTFSDGTEQEFYFANDHPKYPSFFKGIAVILQE